MKSFRVLALSILAFIFVITLAACGGGGSSPKPPATPLAVTTASLANGSVNVPYDFFLQASGGTGTYTWAITKGTLPTNLSFNGTHGEIKGTPNEEGAFPLTVQVTDGAGTVATANLTLNVQGAAIITCDSCTGSSLPFGNPNVPYTATLSASGGKAPYTWCALESDGTCDNGSGGALPLGLTIATSNNNGVISGTPTVPGTPGTVTIEVSDSETPASHGSITLTLTIFDVGPKLLPNGAVDTPYSENLAAIGGSAPFSWTLTGNLPPGLSFGNCQRSQRPTCAISGTPTQAGTSSFTVTVVDGETPPASATTNLTLTIGPAITNSNLSGNYVFTFTGYNNSQPLVMAGEFIADGNGNITGGELDLNNGTGEPNVNCPNGAVGSGPQPQTIATGSVYSINSTGTGTLTLVTNSGTYHFHIAIKQDGSGSLIQDNADPNTRGSGTIVVQKTGVGLGDIEGEFAVSITGFDASGNRRSAAGNYFDQSQQGDLSGPYPLDVNDGGSVSQPTWQGTISTTIDNFGRGCFGNFTFSAPPGAHYKHAYYIVSNNQVVIIGTDPVGGTNQAPLALWTTVRQIVGNQFDNSFLAGPSVITMSGRDTNGAADVLTGLFVGQGVAHNTCQGNNFDPATVTFDQNQGGTVQQQQSLQGTYCVDQFTGRVTLNGFNGQWQTNPPIFYVAGNDPGSIVSTDTAVSTGSLYRQSGSGFSNASVSGLYAGGTILPMVPVATDSVATLFADGAGNLAGPQFISAPSGPSGPNNLRLTYSVDPTGRAVVQNSGQDFGYLYIVSATQFVMLPTGNNPVLNIFAIASAH